MIVAVALTASACASAQRTGGTASELSSATPSAATPTPGDPLQLVGSWHLDAPGQEPGSVLRLGDDLSLWSGCGACFGGWSADRAGLFVAHVSSMSGGCRLPASGGDWTPAWLTKARAFKAGGTSVELLDANGAVVARLTPGAHPTAGPDMASELAAPPTVSADLTQRMRAAAPLPAGLTPATSARLVGRWISADHPDRRGFVDLRADGSWRGSDGANDQGGGWTAGPGGSLVAVAGAQTLVGCAGGCVNIGAWLSEAAHAGFDGSTLVLVDADGSVLGRLAHGPATSPSS
jgi:hypothetical protein